MNCTSIPVCPNCGMETHVFHLRAEECIAACRARIGQLEWTLERIEYRRRQIRTSKKRQAARSRKEIASAAVNIRWQRVREQREAKAS